MSDFREMASNIDGLDSNDVRKGARVASSMLEKYNLDKSKYLAKLRSDSVSSGEYAVPSGEEARKGVESLNRDSMAEQKITNTGYYPEMIPEQQTPDFQQGGESSYYDAPEYDPYLKRDQIYNNKEILKKDIDIKDNIEYTEPETMYPIKDKDSRIAQPQQTEFHETDRDDSER